MSAAARKRDNGHLARISNPPNPWHATRVEWLEGAPEVELQVYEDRTREILSRNDSPDVPFTWSVNCYRGCYHGCAYCYARPSHEYLDFGAGTDFERRIVIKPHAAELLREAFERPRWKGELVVFSGNTDSYQPLEASYGLTRACLEVCLEYRNPAWVITKSPLVERDVELLAALAREAYCGVTVSIPFYDPARARAIEPYVASPRRRLKAIRRLAEAGVPVGVNVAPVIPGLSDMDIARILTEARAAGAGWAACIMVRLPGPVKAVFEERLRAELPDRADRVLSQIQQCRGGELSDPRFGHRMHGTGARWAAIEQLFQKTAERLGFGRAPRVPDPSPFRRPGRGSGQMSLF